MDLHRIAKRLDGVSRRDFLATSARALLGVGLLPLVPGLAAAGDGAPARRPTAKNLIYLYMNGGMSHLDTFDPKPGTETGGPTKAISTSGDLQIAAVLPRLAKQMHHVAVVRSLTSTQGAHEQGAYFMRTGYLLRGTIRHPCLGAWSAKLGGRINPTLPSSVVVGGGGQHPGAGFLEAKYAPLPIGNPESGLQNAKAPAGVDDARYRRRLALAGELDKGFTARFAQQQVKAYNGMYEEAVRLMSSTELAAFDLSKESDSLRAHYGDTPFGQGCLLARRLVEHDVRFVEVNLGGWDTHADNFDRVAEQAQILDWALSALLADLQSRGLLEETLVVLGSEFGRTPKINQNEGRDHYPKAFCGLLAGGGISGGRAWGATDERGAEVASGKCEVQDFNATIAYALGLPLDEVVTSPSGRPFTVADKGRPVTALFS